MKGDDFHFFSGGIIKTGQIHGPAAFDRYFFPGRQIQFLKHRHFDISFFGFNEFSGDRGLQADQGGHTEAGNPPAGEGALRR